MEKQTQLPNLSKFREKCCYCYRSLDDGICMCSCNLSFCGNHRSTHFQKTDCSTVFEASKRSDRNTKEALDVRSESLDDEGVELLKKRLTLIIQCQNADDKIALDDEEMDCPHLNDIDNEDVISIDSLSRLKCSECELSKRMWVCFTCGHIGCGRVQYGIEGNGHAKFHYRRMNHPVFVLANSIKEDYSCKTYCYLCDSDIRNIFASKRLRCTDFAAEEHTDVIKTEDRPEAASEPSPLVGIRNAGNTCYISSILQMIGFAIAESNIDLESHFQICTYENPLDCFYCQLMRVLQKMKEARGEFGECRITIADLIRLIWRDMPMFVRYAQNDAHEFLLLLLEKIKAAENGHQIPAVSPLFEYVTERRVACDKCKEEAVTRDTNSVMCTIIADRLSDSIESLFSGENWTCGCGGNKRSEVRIVKLPPYLIVQVGRYAFGDEGSAKLSDKIEVESVSLARLMGRADEAKLDDLRRRGHPEEEARAALVYSGNREAEAVRHLEEPLRSSPEYEVRGCITHASTNDKVGHYTWWAHTEDRCFLVNDEVVSMSDVSVLEDAYIFLFK
jgi:ubiquitin carboxyl-terminal hydrolase 5/13